MEKEPTGGGLTQLDAIGRKGEEEDMGMGKLVSDSPGTKAHIINIRKGRRKKTKERRQAANLLA
jgi:hypothetical protein